MLYILYIDIYNASFIGVRKKVSAQLRALTRKFGRVYYTIYSGQMIHLISSDGCILEREMVLTWQECHRVIMGWIDRYKISKTYIRYAFADRWLVDFLRGQKENGIRSVMEFPTVPYDGELSNRRIIAEDHYYREKMSDYLDVCTTYSDFDNVFGIPCIPLVNGVDTEEHPARKCRQRDGRIILLAVAYMAGWHGYERVIEGMAEYCRAGGEKKIIFKLVGNGPEIGRYRKLAEDRGLAEQVVFCGELEGEALDRQYDDADIAVGSLGLYKKGVERGAPIKLREYCSRGIPFIYGYQDTGFCGDEEYLMKLPNTDERVDMRAVIAFYERTAGREELIEKMHAAACGWFTWDVIFEPVAEYYRGAE